MEKFFIQTFFAVGIVTTSSLFALTEMPWFRPPLDLIGQAEVNPSFFPSVKDGFDPLDYHSQNLLVKGALLFPILPTIDVEGEITLFRSSKYPFGFESAALQSRILLLDDLGGDPISLDVGCSMRFVGRKRVHDVATPYHNRANFELTTAVGKEWQKGRTWFSRCYLVLGLGQANRGYPWTRFYLRGDQKLFSQLAVEGFLAGYFGLGPRNTVDLAHFPSYAYIQHQNIDIGVGLSYFFKVYGEISFSYGYRLFAHAFPEKNQTFKLTYSIPFSL